MQQKNLAVIGGGIVGLATAFKLQQKFPSAKVHVFEKERALGLHQSGRNSGVLHCGLPYKPGSLKAKLAVSGVRQMIQFCKDHNINHDVCGKVVVASDERENELLLNLAKRGEENGLQGLKILTSLELKKREPYARAHSSLLVPEEGIADYKEVVQTLGKIIQEKDGKIHLSESPIDISEDGLIQTSKNEIQCDTLVFCCGVHSDRTFSKTMNTRAPLKIVPFRGEYYKLNHKAQDLVSHLIYPVPDPKFPFLGVHFTRMSDGSKEVGPNAVLALKREGYTKGSFSLKDAAESLSYTGLHAFARKNFFFALGELKSSLSKKAFLKKAKKLVPDIREEDMIPGPAGIRAQAMSNDGTLLMDFHVEKHGKQVHVLNAPSPGATASLAIADYIIEKYVE